MTRTVNGRRALLGAIVLSALGWIPMAGDPPLFSRFVSSGGAAFYVSRSGHDSDPGTKSAPFATLARAQQALRSRKKTSSGPAVVEVGRGTYALDRPLVFSPEDSGSEASPVVFAASPGESVTISGSRALDCRWKPYRDGILMCDLPAVKQGELRFSQLFVNGKRQTLARFPNRDDSKPGRSGYIQPAARIPDGRQDPKPGENDDMAFSGGAPRGIFFDPASFTAKRWARPEEAVIHIFQDWEWGNLQWQLKAIEYDGRAIWFGEGGFQMGAKWFEDPAKIDKDSRFFIENVLEELDAPGEWYLDVQAGVLYFKPEPGVDIAGARVEAPLLQQLVRFVGTQEAPVRHIALEGFRLTQTASTFLEPYDIPSLSDWAIHRGGTVFLEGTRDCAVRNCWFDTVRETGDHGPFNAWGRERFWSLTQSHSDYSVPRSLEAGAVKTDAMEPVILRNNFFEDQSGWGLDMDDGASNYEIYNNISKGVSIKLREGAYRNVYNNIWVDSNVAPCFHVGNEDNHDRYFRNITVMARDDVYSIIAPPAQGPWLEEIDNNCLFSKSGRFTARISQMRGENGPERGSRRLDFEEWHKLGFDRNSVFADPLFVDPANNDYRVRPESPALRVGFKNFEMGQWGITKEFPRELR